MSLDQETSAQKAAMKQGVFADPKSKEFKKMMKDKDKAEKMAKKQQIRSESLGMTFARKYYKGEYLMSSNRKNRAWCLKKRPQGEIQQDDLELVESDTPVIAENEILAKTIYFLCTEQSSYVSGSEIHINGGQHA